MGERRWGGFYAKKAIFPSAGILSFFFFSFFSFVILYFI